MNNFAALLLSGGHGTRLLPYTKHWPKCLMPIAKRPLLEYWLIKLNSVNINPVIVNLHYLSSIVENFINQDQFKDWVQGIFEKKLLGTAGSLTSNFNILRDKTIILAHADNWCVFDITEFINFHKYSRPKNCEITMMTFRTDTPSTCGILDIDENGIVKRMYEKVEQNHGNIANGAVYIIEPSVLNWLYENPYITDFSSEVIPNYYGKIATWFNNGKHVDIGNIISLQQANLYEKNKKNFFLNSNWQKEFLKNDIHDMIKESN
jgi:mannose-1-phosphate guanylyltransferase